MPQTWLVVQCFQCEPGLKASTRSSPQLICLAQAHSIAMGLAPARSAANQLPSPARPLAVDT
jgi:hypothetical protein